MSLRLKRAHRLEHTMLLSTFRVFNVANPADELHRISFYHPEIRSIISLCCFPLLQSGLELGYLRSPRRYGCTLMLPNKSSSFILFLRLTFNKIF